MPTVICAGPGSGYPCPSRVLVNAIPGRRDAARCFRCRQQWQRAKDARRPERRTAAAIDRNRQAVEQWVSVNGWWCPGLKGHEEPHPSTDLTAEHIDPVALTRDEFGPLIVICRPLNSALGARLAQRQLSD